MDVSWLFGRSADPVRHHECFRCGRSLDRPRAECPECGSEHVQTISLR